MKDVKVWCARHHEQREVTSIQNGYLIIDGAQTNCQNPYELRLILSRCLHTLVAELSYNEQCTHLKEELYELSTFCAQLFMSSANSPVEQMGVFRRGEDGNGMYSVSNQIDQLLKKIEELKQEIKVLKEDALNQSNRKD